MVLMKEPGQKQENYEIDAKTYAKLTSQTNWDSNGDAVIDGTKYRRISADDVVKVNNGVSYFIGIIKMTYPIIIFDMTKSNGEF